MYCNISFGRISAFLPLEKLQKKQTKQNRCACAEQGSGGINADIGKLTAPSLNKKLMKFIGSRVENGKGKRCGKILRLHAEACRKKRAQKRKRGKFRHMRSLAHGKA